MECPPCARCFEPTTGISVGAPDLTSRTKAKLAGLPLPNLIVQAKPCGHLYSDEHWQAWKAATGLKVDTNLGDWKAPRPKRKKRKR